MNRMGVSEPRSVAGWPSGPHGGDEDRGHEDAGTRDARARRHAPDADPLRWRGRASGAGGDLVPLVQDPVRAGGVHHAVSNFVLARLTAARSAPAVVPSTSAASSYVAPSMAVITSADRSSG